MVDVAVAEGYNIIVLPGYVFASTVIEVTDKYPDIQFIVLDMGGGDVCAAAVGNTYYDNPDAYDPADYYNTDNTFLAIYQEAIPGYLAGYAAVKLGYRNLGFLGGQAVPGVMRYGYGFLQGVDAAANPSTFYNMLPYIVSLVVLAIFSKNSRAPKAEGIPYDKGQR